MSRLSGPTALFVTLCRSCLCGASRAFANNCVLAQPNYFDSTEDGGSEMSTSLHMTVGTSILNGSSHVTKVKSCPTGLLTILPLLLDTWYLLLSPIPQRSAQSHADSLLANCSRRVAYFAYVAPCHHCLAFMYYNGKLLWIVQMPVSCCPYLIKKSSTSYC